MGGTTNKQFQGDHILHYYSFFDNKIYVYLPEKDKFYKFDVYRKNLKYNFIGQETISLPSGSIYILGGQVINPEVDEESIGPDNYSENLVISDFCAKINLNKQENCKLDLDRCKPCKSMPEPRTSHLLIYCKPYIYAIGGYLEGNKGTNTCLRFHTANKDWEEIAEIPSQGYMKEPCGISVNDSNIYIFETKLTKKLPLIHKYNVQNNQWKTLDVAERNKAITIPPSFNCSVYQSDHTELLLLGGVLSEGKQKNFYYKFDVNKEQFTEPVEDSSRDVWSKERQGNLDYTDRPKIFTRLGDGVIKFYKKKEKEWRIDDLVPDIVTSEGNWCTSGRR